MAIDIVITQRSLFKKPLTEADLSPAGLRIGHWNQAGVLDPGPAADGRVLCDPAQPGRGCFLQAVPGEKGRAALWFISRRTSRPRRLKPNTRM